MDTSKFLEQHDANNEKIIKLLFSRWNGFPKLLKSFGVKKMVEVGTYNGKYAECLCRLIPDVDLTCVDAFEIYDGYKDYADHDLAILARTEASERAERCGFKLIKAFSMDAVKSFEDESLDAVFIDGNHDFSHVVEDVAAWSKKVKKGGVVSGHDFFRDHRHGFGVFEAIPAWCDANDIKPLFVVTKDKCPSWFYVKT